MADKEYIERGKLIEDLKILAKAQEPYKQSTILGVIVTISQRRAADVVEVVRCKDCEYCHISIDPKTNISVQVCGYVGYNPVQSSQVTDNDFCSHGERKEQT